MTTNVTSILEKLPALECLGSRTREIRRIVSAQIDEILETDLTWVSDKNISIIDRIKSGCIILSNNANRPSLNEAKCTYLIVQNPRMYFMQVAKLFFTEAAMPFISPHTYIDPTVIIGEGVTIRAGVVIEANCVIGNSTQIDSNTVIKKGTKIGSRVKIGANNTIGGDGFGYEMNQDREFEFIPHLGNVVIEDDVEIGNNTTIDRAVLGSTFLRKNVKVDNLVHIAHGVDVGENSLIIANAMIAGSCVIGKNVWVAPSASILNKAKVGDNAMIGMGAVVLKNVEPGQVIVGNPGKDINQRPKS